MSKPYSPPYSLTSAIVSLIAQIGEAVGRLSAHEAAATSLRLRRINRIRTIQGSLAIEGNTLSKTQITAILVGQLIRNDTGDFLEPHGHFVPVAQFVFGDRINVVCLA